MITNEVWSEIWQESNKWVEDLKLKYPKTMVKEEIKERAKDKIWAKYFNLLNESMTRDLFWSMDKDRQEQLMEAHLKDVEVYSYILSLIEKDNK